MSLGVLLTHGGAYHLVIRANLNLTVTYSVLITTIVTQMMMRDMKHDLANIARQMDDLGDKMRREETVYRQELADRQRRGLHGVDAIRHYNDWMLAAGMTHLMVREIE